MLQTKAYFWSYKFTILSYAPNWSVIYDRKTILVQATGGFKSDKLFPSHDLFFPGEDRELTGSLLSIDSQEGVVKLDQVSILKLFLRRLRFGQVS